MAKSIILRPSADVLLEHSVYPDASAPGYLQIRDEKCDEESTYIFLSVEGGDYATATSSFKMSASNIINKPSFVTNAIFVICPNYTDVLKGRNNVTVSVFINGAKIVAWDEALVWGTTNTDVKDDFQPITKELTDVIFVINEYISSTGALPDVEISISSQVSGTANNEKSSDAPKTQKISQIYIELICEVEENIGIFDKINGTYKASSRVYKKTDNLWSEISDTEAKTILKNNDILRG